MSSILIILHNVSCIMAECSRHYKCHLSYCVPLFLVCNGQIDCPMGDDEENCKPSTCFGLLKCHDGSVCIHIENICDGFNDCPHGDDERHCIMMDNCPDTCSCHGYITVCSTAHNTSLMPQFRLSD